MFASKTSTIKVIKNTPDERITQKLTHEVEIWTRSLDAAVQKSASWQSGNKTSSKWILFKYITRGAKLQMKLDGGDFEINLLQDDHI